MIKQRGAALITALLVISIVAAISIALMMRLEIDIERSSLNFNADKAYLETQNVLDWAIVKYLGTYQLKQQGLPPPAWPVVMEKVTIPGGYTQGYLQNAQGRLNINNLSDPSYQPILARLIQYLQPRISLSEAMQLASNVTQWLTPISNQGNTIDPIYQQKNPPYRAAHRTMLSASELRLVDGFTPALYQLLEPYIVALPQPTSIDVNAASIPVLIAGGVSETGAATTVNYLRSNPGFMNIAQFQQLSQFQASQNPSSAPIFDVNSTFFYARAEIVLGNVYFIAYYLLQYQKETNSMTVLRYSQGTL